jgi:tRNA/rRNA methyltransferase
MKKKYSQRMNLDNIVIVLDRPEESRNVGAVCRAMANNGIHCLRIVGDKKEFDDTHVRILAIHADTIWDNAHFFDSITAATADCVFSCGTTRRRGKNRIGKLLLPEEFTEIAANATGSKENGLLNSADSTHTGGKVAVVFGNERTGLTDEEIDECSMGVTIPSSEEFGSLNLSHAVQIMCYHLFRSDKKVSPGYIPITQDRLAKTVGVITDDLKKIGFFTITGKPEMEQYWKAILSRASLSESEAQYIEKVFNKAAGLSSKNMQS